MINCVLFGLVSPSMRIQWSTCCLPSNEVSWGNTPGSAVEWQLCAVRLRNVPFRPGKELPCRCFRGSTHPFTLGGLEQLGEGPKRHYVTPDMCWYQGQSLAIAARICVLEFSLPSKPVVPDRGAASPRFVSVMGSKDIVTAQLRAYLAQVKQQATSHEDNATAPIEAKPGHAAGVPYTR